MSHLSKYQRTREQSKLSIHFIEQRISDGFFLLSCTNVDKKKLKKFINKKGGLFVHKKIAAERLK